MTRQNNGWHDPADDDTAELLRAALHEQAESISTSSDALQRIRARTHRRNVPGRLRTGGLIVATAAAVAAAIVLVPRALTGHGNDHQTATGGPGTATTARSHVIVSGPNHPGTKGRSTAGGHASAPLTAASKPGAGPTQSPATPTPPTAPSPDSTAPATPTSTGQGATNLPTVGADNGPKIGGGALVWPVPDISAPHHSKAALAADPRVAAVTFVRTMVGSAGGGAPAALSATEKPTGHATAMVTVNRTIAGRPHVVCLARAVAIGSGPRRFWGIQDAMGGSGDVRIDGAPLLAGKPLGSSVTVRGFAGPGSGAQGVMVMVAPVGSTDNYSFKRLQPAGAFIADLPLTRAASARGVVLVWTTDALGEVVSFAAEPTN